MEKFGNIVNAPSYLLLVALSAIFSSACVAEEDLGADSESITAGTTGDESSSETETTGAEAPQGVDQAPSKLKSQSPSKGACGPNTKEYFVIRAGLGGQSMAIDIDYNVYAWGTNDKGQLGIGSMSSPRTTPTKLAGGQKFLDLAGGDKHTLGLAVDGTVWAWGDNTYGQLANTTTSIPKKVAGLSNVVQIAAGARFSLALTAQGQLYAWGDNTYGQLGLGTIGGTKGTPQLVTSMSNPTKINAGKEFTAALKGDRLYLWGRDDTGQLGNGNPTANQGAPTVVSLTGVYDFVVGPAHTLAFTPQATSKWYAWGGNSSGQLGTGDTTTRISPTPIIGPSFLYATPLFASATSTFIAGASGFGPPKPGLEIVSAGGNGYRQLLHTGPNPTKTFTGMKDVLKEGWDNGVNHGYLQALAPGNGYTLALVGTTVKAIGFNTAGQLGDGTLTSRNTPTNVCLP